MNEGEPSLDRPLDEFQRDLVQCVELIIERYRTMHDANTHPGVDEAVVKSWFDEALPDAGMPVSELLADVDKTVIAHPTMNIGARMFAYVMSGGTQVSVLAELLASALDQNVAKWHLAPSMTEIERRVIAWTAEFLGFNSDPGGALVSGGSAANLTGLTVARNLFAERAGVREQGLFGMAPLVTYASTQTHASVEKSVELLGLGSANLRKVPTHDDFTIDVAALRQRITADRDGGLTPFCIVANAGTVNTGAIDPMDQLADVAQEFGLWLHVDAAYGGFAAALESKRMCYAGLERADSIALDYHKWLYQPFEVGCTLVRNWQALERTFNKSAEYLDYGAHEARFDFSKHHFALSRNAKAFKVWMTFKTYGAQQLRAMIAKDIDNAAYLADCVEQAEDFELVEHGPLAIICFRYRGEIDSIHVDIADIEHERAQLNTLNARLLDALELDGRIFITGTLLRGKHVIRACIINHRTGRADVDFLLATIRSVARTL